MKITSEISIYFSVRPVVLADTGHLESRNNDPFTFDGHGVTVVRGSSAEITCPVIAFPTARFTWTKDGKEFSVISGIFFNLKRRLTCDTSDAFLQLLTIFLWKARGTEGMGLSSHFRTLPQSLINNPMLSWKVKKGKGSKTVKIYGVKKCRGKFLQKKELLILSQDRKAIICFFCSREACGRSVTT